MPPQFTEKVKRFRVLKQNLCSCCLYLTCSGKRHAPIHTTHTLAIPMATTRYSTVTTIIIGEQSFGGKFNGFISLSVCSKSLLWAWKHSITFTTMTTRVNRYEFKKIRISKSEILILYNNIQPIKYMESYSATQTDIATYLQASFWVSTVGINTTSHTLTIFHSQLYKNLLCIYFLQPKKKNFREIPGKPN